MGKNIFAITKIKGIHTFKLKNSRVIEYYDLFYIIKTLLNQVSYNKLLPP